MTQLIKYLWFVGTNRSLLPPPVCRTVWLLGAVLLHLGSADLAWPQVPEVDVTFNPGASSSVRSMAVQVDGKILVGGDFTTLGGESRNRIGRLSGDGATDSGFNSGANSGVYAIALQEDGRLLVSGGFTALGGLSRNGIGRLNSNGTGDGAFNPNANGLVSTIALQVDGKILLGGGFTSVDSQTRHQIARLNADGTLDESFNPGADDWVLALALQPDGKILVGGSFTNLAGQSRSLIARLNADGTLDEAFNPGANYNVRTLVVQADGKILVGGDFTTLGGQPRNRIGRLNPDGTLDSTFNPGANNAVGSMEVQTDGKILVGGWFTSLGGQPRSHLARLNPDGTLDTAFDPGADERVSSIAIQADGKIVIGGNFTVLGGQPRSRIGRLHNTGPASQNLNYDRTTITWTRGGTGPEVWWTSFAYSTNGVTWNNLGTGTRVTGGWRRQAVDLPTGALIRARGFTGNGGRSGGFVESLLTNNLPPSVPPMVDDFNPGANLTSITFFSLALQADGKVLVGGGVSTLEGPVHNGIGRLLPDGTPDPTFISGADDSISAMAVQPDGRIVVGGNFSTLGGGLPRPWVGRINRDGFVDDTFSTTRNPILGGSTLNCLELLPDGWIRVGGSWTLYGEHLAGIHNLVIMGPNGSVVTEHFGWPFGGVQSLALQADGKLLVGGHFTYFRNQPRERIARLNPDGLLDTNFNAEVTGGFSSAHPFVTCLLVQSDGKILVAGEFTTLCGQPRNRIGRLHPDGTLDADFNPGANGNITSLALQADGRILVGGAFTTLGGQTRHRIGRLHPDGTLDMGFNPGASILGRIDALVLQPDGKILVGGSFVTLGGQPREHIGRLNNTGPATKSLSYADGTITWLRGGTSPEIWRAIFDWTSDGTNWTSLGEGTRVLGGWALTNVTVPPDVTLRAQGYTSTGGNRWHVADYVGPLLWVGQPESRTNKATTTVSFFATVGGTPPLSYQWFKNGLPLNEGGNVHGATSPSLVLTNVLGADAGNYHVVVSNAFNVLTSKVASLVVIDPVIMAHPTNQNVELGQSGTFIAPVVGTSPLAYQWWKDGVKLTGRTNASWTLTNAQMADAGRYQMVVTSPYGSATSQWASFTVNSTVVDSMFDLGPSAAGAISSIALQANGQVLGAGSVFIPGWPTRGIIRLNPEGTLDSNFNPASGTSAGVIAVQTDGKILVGGGFTTLDGQPRERIGRLNPDGTVDGTFEPGANSNVRTIVEQADGKILVGGTFTTLGGQHRNRIGRLNPDGTLDPGFNPDASNTVYCIAIQADGKILVGGAFTTLGGEPRNRIGRLNPDGTLDSTFVPEANNLVYCLAVQADGKILVGGIFSTLGGQPRSRIGRLNSDGTLDSTFDPGVNDWPGGSGVHSLGVQTDGRILVGGDFHGLGGQSRRSIGRLNADGTLDLTFNPGRGGSVYSLAVQADGKIILGGGFTSLNTQIRNAIGRLSNTTPATQSLSCDGENIIWLRGGAGPEVWRTAFSWSSDGENWTPLGSGVRRHNGWDLESVHVPLGAIIRARGFPVGTSAGIVESLVTNTPAPDLVVAELNAPTQLTLGTSATITWTVLNRGRSPATNGWLDRVYLSPDVNPANGWLAGEFPNPGPLATNATVDQVQTITLPAGLDKDTDYWWIIVTDATSSVTEQDEANNTRVSEGPMQLVITPADPPSVVIELNLDPGNNGATVRVVTVEGLTYTLEYKDYLEDPEWKTLQQLVGDGGERMLEDGGPLQERRFYRVRVH